MANNQPFYICGSKGKFHPSYRFYLPALEDREEQTAPIEKDTEWTSRQWDAVNQLKAQILHLQNKLNEHLDRSKKKHKF